MDTAETLYRVVLVQLPDSGRVYRYKAPLTRAFRPHLSGVRVPTPTGPEIGTVVGIEDTAPAGLTLKWVEER